MGLITQKELNDRITQPWNEKLRPEISVSSRDVVEKVEQALDDNPIRGVDEYGYDYKVVFPRAVIDPSIGSQAYQPHQVVGYIRPNQLRNDWKYFGLEDPYIIPVVGEYNRKVRQKMPDPWKVLLDGRKVENFDPERPYEIYNAMSPAVEMLHPKEVIPRWWTAGHFQEAFDKTDTIQGRPDSRYIARRALRQTYRARLGVSRINHESKARIDGRDYDMTLVELDDIPLDISLTRGKAELKVYGKVQANMPMTYGDNLLALSHLAYYMPMVFDDMMAETGNDLLVHLRAGDNDEGLDSLALVRHTGNHQYQAFLDPMYLLRAILAAKGEDVPPSWALSSQEHLFTILDNTYHYSKASILAECPARIIVPDGRKVFYTSNP